MFEFRTGCGGRRGCLAAGTAFQRRGSLAGPLAALAVLLAVMPARAADRLPVVEVAPRVYVFTGAHENPDPDNLGAISNIGFIVGDAAVAVIDTGGSLVIGERLLTAIRRVSDRPVRYVINTHAHPDHIMGNAAFVAEGAQFVGHRKLPRAVAARGSHYLARLSDLLGAAADGSEIVAPTVTVRDELDLDLGGRTLRLTAYPTAHTDADLTVFDNATGVLWTGDLLFTERTPVVDGSLKGWLGVIATLRGRDATLVIPGHGRVTANWPGALDAQGRYLTVIAREIRALITAGGTIEDAIARVGQSERGAWRLFDDYHPRNVTASFAELEWE